MKSTFGIIFVLLEVPKPENGLSLSHIVIKLTSHYCYTYLSEHFNFIYFFKQEITKVHSSLENIRVHQQSYTSCGGKD